MIYTPDELLKLIYDTKALSIWNRKSGPIFWYIAGVPGPFYVNTEIMLGKDLANRLLADIDSALAGVPASDPAARAARLRRAISEGFKATPVYRNIIATMIAKANEQFPPESYRFVSGGERRDWLFSIPFAEETGREHLYLFKNGTAYAQNMPKAGESGLHVSDLVNNAVSYTDLWLPALAKAGFKCAGTICVICRGANGAKALLQQGIKMASLQNIDVDLFEQSEKSGLITKDQLGEIKLHFASPAQWGGVYLFENPALFDAASADKKSFERMRSFAAADPWQLRRKHEAIFAKIEADIAARLKSSKA